ncbi:MAG TPA: MFS transporter, partial [Burkholderiaceae bacterium]|nr:MFS transporter [Burkholderiaceae bacterium]
MGGKTERRRLMRRSFLAVLHPPYFGTWVVRAAFLIALFGWGVGFYGPPIFLHTVIERTGWALELVSAAITVHFLAGALCAAQLPRIHRRFGVAATTRMGAIVASVALLGWATAPSPTALFVAALASGVGWATMGAVALNLIVSPWYTSGRPAALSAAYNGASIAG